MINTHPALRAQTLEEFDRQQATRPLVPMVVCRECERLKRKNEALEAKAKDLEIAARMCISELYNRHILHNHNADFEVCQMPVCEAARRLELALDGES